ncbi:hypothetical protein ACFL1H_07700 [Nanoarchaeota archaeon]
MAVAVEFLDDLKGNKERDIKLVKNSNVDKLMSEMFNILNIDIDNYEKVMGNGGGHRTYDKIYNQTKKRLKRTKFTQDDLKTLIYSTNYGIDLNEKILIGHYTGALLQLLSERNKGITFYMNGHRLEYSYLFIHSKLSKKDNIILENFKGNNICGNMANKGSNVNLVAIINSEGSDLGCSIGAHDGHANNVFLINNNGHAVGNAIAWEGYVKNIIKINNNGYGIGHVAHANGKAGLVFIAKNEGTYVGSDIGYGNGNVNEIVLLKNKGEGLGLKIANLRGTCKKLFLFENIGYKVKDEETKIGFKPSYVREVYTNKNRGDMIQGVRYKEKINGIKAKNAFNDYIEQKNLQPILDIVENPEQCTGETFAYNLIKIAEAIR